MQFRPLGILLWASTNVDPSHYHLGGNLKVFSVSPSKPYEIITIYN